MTGLWAGLPSLAAWGIHVAICVTIVSAIGTWAIRVCHKQSAHLRHTLACSFLAALVLMPGLTAVYHWNLLPQRSITMSRAMQPAATSARKTTRTVEPRMEPSLASAEADTSTDLRLSIGLFFGIVWFGGSLTRYSQLAVGLRRRYAFSKTWDKVKGRHALALLERHRTALGIDRRVALRTSPVTPTPFTIGILCPKIVLPEYLVTNSRTDGELESVLLHELAHVRRFDYAITILASLIEAFYWWIPSLRTMRNELVVAREEICDSYVLTHTGDGEPLANYLVVSLEHMANERFAWGVGMSANDPKTVELRITQLVSGDNNVKLTPQYVKGGVLCLSVALCIACVHVNYARASLSSARPSTLVPLSILRPMRTAPSCRTMDELFIFTRIALAAREVLISGCQHASHLLLNGLHRRTSPKSTPLWPSIRRLSQMMD